MIAISIICLLEIGVMGFLIYRGFGIIVEDFKLTRLLMQAQQKEMIAAIQDLNCNLVMILGGELGDSLKKYLKMRGNKNVVIRKGKVVPVDEEY
jgi:hypothetical protein